VQGDGVEAAVLGEAREVDADDVVVVPAHAELDGKGLVTAARTARKMRSMAGRSRNRPEPPLQPTTRFGRAAEVQVDEIEAGVLDDARGVCEGGRIRPEQLRRYRVLVVVVVRYACA